MRAWPKACFILLVFACSLAAGPGPLPPSPDELYGELFADVQRSGIFPDQKTFPDCTPKDDPATIAAAYAKAKAAGTPVDLKRFVEEHFEMPRNSPTPATPAATLDGHLAGLWDTLTRMAGSQPEGASLLPLPKPYVVPGGRFQELYYWDTYFTMLGLRADGREDLIASMADDLASEAASYGLIPNGNRTYYLTRSQPPLLALMVEFLAEKEGDRAYRRFLPALRAEHAYWTDRTFQTRHVVRLADGGHLDRYYDRASTPRPEAFVGDVALTRSSAEPAAILYRNLRSAAESGWDFSSRWFGEGGKLADLDTTDVVPVDLNCMLVQLERTLAKACAEEGAAGEADAMRAAADRRVREIQADCWSSADGFYFDYDLRRRARRSEFTLAGVAPLFFGIASPAQAGAVAGAIRARFLRPGGVVTTLVASGEQWDAPNGWAPLEWMTIRGLARYGHDDLAREIAARWLALNRAVYRRTGKMEEKYDVEDLSKNGNGGEYPAQDGFGWTNGVFLALEAMYPGL